MSCLQFIRSRPLGKNWSLIRVVAGWTIESSAREFMGKSSSTTLAASVNFVDLAGSERASQALSAESRLKEGCHINRSLLTLGTVIRKLRLSPSFLAYGVYLLYSASNIVSKPTSGLFNSTVRRQGHINYRDSKLTRILQPSLGGNSRTSIICTLSPARSHVEQTRNTLLFACCAKQVTTKAQVNVVMSDKVLVKQLQKEVARLESELRTPCPPSTNCDCAAMLRKKNLQIQKMEREIRELIEQRHLAQSQIEDLMCMVGNGQKSRKNTRCCKEIQSVELEESSRDDLEYADLSVSNNGVLALTLYGEENVISQEIPTPVNEDREEKQNQLTYGVLEQRLDDSQLSNDSPMTMSETVPNCRNFKLLRSWSCREYYTSSSPEKAGVMERTPASSFEKCFPGRLCLSSCDLYYPKKAA
ncbi:Kinesin-related protein 11 [Glycine soja]|uniref:Kinesin-like protein n=1 Tax=Glycine soja TaxID=3848 RepID=A0A0B2QGX6_GLYSO|nr:Kinesin-related protein 11 [Glycine soja]